MRTSFVRPICPKCGMRMIAIALPETDSQKYECLRCGHAETFDLEGLKPVSHTD